MTTSANTLARGGVYQLKWNPNQWIGYKAPIIFGRLFGSYDEAEQGIPAFLCDLLAMHKNQKEYDEVLSGSIEVIRLI